MKFAGGADDHHRPTLGEMGQNRRRKGPSALADAVERQHSSLFHAFEEGLQSGSFAQLGQDGRGVWLGQTQFRRDSMGQARGGVKRRELKKLKKEKKAIKCLDRAGRRNQPRRNLYVYRLSMMEACALS